MPVDRNAERKLWGWQQIPGTRRRPDSELPGPWRPLFGLYYRIWALRELIRDTITGRPAGQSEER